jgi:hypothetical protein
VGGASQPGNIPLLQALRQVSEFAREAVQDAAQDPGAQHLISEAIIAEELAEPAELHLAARGGPAGRVHAVRRYHPRPGDVHGGR